jgi:hypothetical protein
MVNYVSWISLVYLEFNCVKFEFEKESNSISKSIFNP